jgi:hypothetical protein
VITPGRAIADLSRERPVLATVWFAVLGTFVAGCLARDDDRVWAYVAFLLILTGALAVTDRTVGFSDHALWLLCAAGALHLCGGLLPGWDGHRLLYEAWIVPQSLRFDQAAHAFGSAAIAVAMWEVLGTFMRPDTSVRSQAMLAVICAQGKGALNEVLEFAMSTAFADTIVGGYENTGWDLVFNLMGACWAALLLLALAARRRPAPRTLARSSPDELPATPTGGGLRPQAHAQR